MTNSANGSIILTYLQKHWFKAGCLVLVLYLFIQKDFRFSINMNSPTQSEPLEISPNEYAPQAGPKKEIFTERTKNSAKILDKFEMPSIFSSKPKYNPMVELTKVEEQIKQDYLKRFARVVINERRKYGIPSSIILACGLLQSHAGQRDMAKQGNNHFALNCPLGFEGPSGTYQDNCYQHYENAWTSYRNHSIYLTTGKYAKLSTLSSYDYKAWANGLENLGYNQHTDDLARYIIEIIETYSLDELDRR